MNEIPLENVIIIMQITDIFYNSRSLDLCNRLQADQ